MDIYIYNILNSMVVYPVIVIVIIIIIIIIFIIIMPKQN